MNFVTVLKLRREFGPLFRWIIQPIPGYPPRLVMDSSGPHIAYIDRGQTNFSYAEFDESDAGINCGEYGSNEWFRCDVLSNNAIVGSQASVGIGYDTYPHVAIYDRSIPVLRYATLNTSWSYRNRG